jgi:transposase
MTTEIIKPDPFSGALFVFRKRRGDCLKILDWAGDGFALGYRRLERGTFRFPSCHGDAAEIRGADRAMILDGVDLTSVRRRPRYVRPPAEAPA